MFRVPEIDSASIAMRRRPRVRGSGRALAGPCEAQTHGSRHVLVRDAAAPNIDNPACELRRGVRQPLACVSSRVNARRSPSFLIPSSRARLSIALSARPATSRAARGARRPRRHQSVLAVMGTGRGKSLIFHVHAAREAVFVGVRASLSIRCVPSLLTRPITSRRRWLRSALARAC